MNPTTPDTQNGKEPTSPTTPVRCAWCGIWLAGEPTDPSGLVSHGICPDCAASIEEVTYAV